MIRHIIQIIISCGLIIGGLTQKLVLIGTNSSIALVIVGFILLAVDIYLILKPKKSKDKDISNVKWWFRYILLTLCVFALLMLFFMLIASFIVNNGDFSGTSPIAVVILICWGGVAFWGLISSIKWFNKKSLLS